jgi:hypothetical protein
MGFIINPYQVQPSGDADAQAFITAAGITDSTQKSAIETLVTDLKGYGIWTKMKAIYPFVGGTSTTHKYNLKDPQDTDGAFRLVFSGGWTHSSTGALPNGTNAYADTYFNPQSQSINKSSFGASIYLRTNNTGYYVDFGALDSVANSYIWSVIRYNGSLDFFGIFDDSFFNGNYSSRSDGFFTIQRDSSTTQKALRNGSQIGQRTAFSATSDINLNIFLAARNLIGSPSNYSNRENSFTAFHDSLNSTEASNFYTAVQAFQTTLSRNV